MYIVISEAGAARSRDLAQLRDWLDADGAAPWRLQPEPPQSGDSLGASVTEISAVVVAAAHLAMLIERIHDWFGTRDKPGAVQVTITINPAEPMEDIDAEPVRDEQPA